MEALQTAAEAHGKDKVEGELIPIQMDETNVESIKKAYETISSKHDKLNLLINNAGLSSERADVSQAEKGPEAFKEALLKVPFDNWNEVVRNRSPSV
jgi:NADP-dependent 3-hydroxy acid dehydrogenase YdfG